MPTILLTGFEPFAGADCNPSARVAESLARETIGYARLVTATLPVVAAEVPVRFASLVEQHAPDVVLCLGEARGAEHIRVERRAVNRLAFVIDNSGACATDQPVVVGGPLEYWSSIPVDEVLEALAACRVPCEPSLSAGTFCCNQLLFHALHDAAIHRSGKLAGFLHLPSLPEQCVAGRAVGVGMPLEVQVKGVRAVLDVIAKHLSRRNDAPCHLV